MEMARKNPARVVFLHDLQYLRKHIARTEMAIPESPESLFAALKAHTCILGAKGKWK
jgi:hypothetical protein